MAAAPPTARARFQADLGSALRIAEQATTGRTQRSNDANFGRWQTFCQELNCPVTLSHVANKEERLCYLLVFAQRYRTKGATNNPVRADTVSKALLAVGKGFTNLGEQDPRFETPGATRYHPLLNDYLKKLRDDDDPANRTYPANITILAAPRDCLDFQDSEWGAFNSQVADHIQLLGRWKSDAMFRYLRIQVATRSFSQQMLDHGAYTFAPGTYAQPDPLPQEAPPLVAQLLTHAELYED